MHYSEKIQKVCKRLSEECGITTGPSHETKGDPEKLSKYYAWRKKLAEQKKNRLGPPPLPRNRNGTKEVVVIKDGPDQRRRCLTFAVGFQIGWIILGSLSSSTTSQENFCLLSPLDRLLWYRLLL